MTEKPKFIAATKAQLSVVRDVISDVCASVGAREALTSHVKQLKAAFKGAPSQLQDALLKAYGKLPQYKGAKLGTVHEYNGKWTIKWATKGKGNAARKFHNQHVAKLLPAVTKRSKQVAKPKRLTAEEKREKAEKQAENSIVRLARRIRLARDEQGLTPRQIKEAIALAFSRKEL